jgi:hypothetical protein
MRSTKLRGFPIPLRVGESVEYDNSLWEVWSFSTRGEVCLMRCDTSRQPLFRCVPIAEFEVLHV